MSETINREGKYLTLVFKIVSDRQQTELLAQSGWVANSHSDAIQERDALQRRVNSMGQEIERLQQRLKNVTGYHQAWFAHAQELEKQLEAVGAGGVEPLRRGKCLHQIAEPVPAVSTLDCKGPLCGCPEYGGGHHPLCRHAALKLPTAATGIDSPFNACMYQEQCKGWRDAAVRKPLTDEQIQNVLYPIVPSGIGYFLSMARAIEAAHGITKEGAAT